MRHCLLALVLPALTWGCHADPTAQASPPAAAPSPSGHYCNLAVFTPEEKARHHDIVEKFRTAVGEHHELANGYAFDFPGTFKEAGEWADGVRRCCPTVEVALDFSPRSGPAVLRVTGDGAAKEFIREEFKALFGGG